MSRNAGDLRLPLLRGTISLDEALDNDSDMLRKLSLPQKRLDFFLCLFNNKEVLEAIVAFHLGLPSTACTFCEEVRDWMYGSFNLCIPIDISYRGSKYENKPPTAGRVLIRVPLPYKVGDDYSPGNSEEKLRCEVATYIWIKENCPNVPIPHLYGFGTSDGYCFTAPVHVKLLGRLLNWFRRHITAWQTGVLPCSYVRQWHELTQTLQMGYMIIEDVQANNEMLSSIWDGGHTDAKLRANLYRDLAQITLQLSSNPFPKIGSLTVDTSGVIALTNRPLIAELFMLENENVPTRMPRNRTYTTSIQYFLGLFACHESRFRTHRNPVHDKIDACNQISAIMILKTLLGFVSHEAQHELFFLTLTDLHTSNVFVDADWHVTHIIDLEWACTLPAEMIFNPLCLTRLKMDQLTTKENLSEFNDRYIEFTDIFEAEEVETTPSAPIAKTLKEMWKDKRSFWFTNALRLLYTGPMDVFHQHLCPPDFTLGDFRQVLPLFWDENVEEIMEERMSQKTRYVKELQATFEEMCSKIEEEEEEST